MTSMHFLPLEKVYGFDAIPKELTKEESNFVLGAHGNVWTEYITTPEEVEYMVFPRIFALSEVVWSKNKPSFEVFEKKVIDFYPILNDMDINYSKHIERLEE